MNAVRESCRPKHQVLILKCFPRYQKGVLEVKPNSSELSYLLYYVSTRRSKLQKVGAFLEKKTARDVSKGRIGNVQVALQILTALVEALPRELPLYAQSVLTIIETVISSKDITMVEGTVPTFEMFCSSQDLSVLAAEQQYAAQYLNIVQSYADFASSKTKGPLDTANNLPMKLRLKNIGLRAIRSMVGSESLSADGGKQLSIIVPVILENLYADSEDTLVSLHLKSKDSDKAESEIPRHHRRMSTATVSTADPPAGDAAEASGTTADADKAAELEVRLLALRCLEHIFVVSTNRSQIRTAAGLVLEFIVDHDGNSGSEKTTQDSSAWAQSLMELIAKWCPVQDRFIVLFTAVEILRGMSADELPVQQQIVMASLIDSLLKSPVNMIGLSVIDVLVGFVQHILRLLQTPSPPASQAHLPATKEGEAANDPTVNDGDLEKPGANPPQSHPMTPENERLVTLLKQCIGDLATHIYYANQIFDMIQTLLKRIRPPVLSDATAGAATNNVSEPSTPANQISNTAYERHSENFFYSADARIAALEAVKNILVVANLKKAALTGAGIVSRNPVGIQVWEGTQWLLRDSDRQVQTAYAEAFLSWLQLETSKSDLQVKDSTKKVFRSLSKKEPAGGRKASTSSAVTDKKPASVSSNFLQLLHLTLYDIAVEFASVEPQIFVVYLLLVNLVEHLGVNAVRFGLPMVLALQEVVPPSESLSSADAQVNIGSLVYGYLSALTEKFDFETSKVGAGIQAEISRRKKRGAWLECIQLPPLSLSQIPANGNKVSNSDIDEPFHIFSATEDVVRQVENAYTASLIAAPQSPPGSPGRNITPQVPGQAFSNPNQDFKLPADIKEDMLSPWSRDANLAILEKEKIKAASLAGSKHASSAKRNYGSLNGFGRDSPNRDSSPATDRQDTNGPDAFGTSVSGFQVPRSASLPDRSLAGSNRDSTIRVNDLKRMLTVGGGSNVRRSSPLRGRLDASSASIASSSSESLISGTFSTSDFGAESRPQSIRDNGRSASREGPETPKAARATSPSGKNNSNENSFTDLGDDIPPVPPLPSGLAIPGGFPESSSNVSRQSSVRSDHPSPSPTTVNFARNTLVNKNSGQLGRTLSGKKSRSNNSLNASASRKTTPTAIVSPATPNAAQPPSSRLEIDKLLDGVLPQESSPHFDHIQLTLETPGSTRGKSRTLEDRRKITSGIGRPPY
ncbi:Protein EFR3 [Talaromyces islandicus]|uniref:Protein EFR3 n=1 Tax=Talaromyces islandicus TaxID=28573 RepID=A0A0U1LR42_TALIS|nr:Protein EFR3 [Talaromyces islandicus]